MSTKKKKGLKKKIIIIAIIVVIILFLIIMSAVNNYKKVIEENKISTEKIEKRTISKSISATGTIKSTNTKEYTATLVGSEVKSVNVKVGDKVNPGDALISFNVDTLNDSLNLAQEGLNITKQQTDLGINAAQKGFSSAVETRDSQNNALNSNINDIENSIKNIDNQIAIAKDTLKQFQEATKTEETNLASVNTKNKEIIAEYNNKRDEYTKALAEYDNAKVNGKETEEAEALNKVNKAKAELDSCESTYNIAQKENEKAEEKLNEARTALLQAQAGITELQTTKSTLEAQLKQAKSTADSTRKNLDSAVDSAALNLDTSILSARSSILTQENQIKTVKDQIDKGTITSDVAGTVTAVNAEVGDIYQGGTLVKVEGCETFMIEAQIDEYDIADVAVGMKVKIKTDATRDEELIGRVTFVSPTATETASAMAMTTTASSSSDATYKVEIAIDSVNDRLRIGMNAKLNIITEEADNVLTVPYDAIEEKEDGKNIIRVVENDDDENAKEIEVTKGLESDYYTEIKSDKIKEGMKVVVPDSGNGDALSTIINTMQTTSGF